MATRDNCTGGRGTLGRMVAAVLLVAAIVALWWAVFTVTELVGEPPAAAKVARPPAVSLPQPDTDWVNLEAWRRTHPSWVPQP